MATQKPSQQPFYLPKLSAPQESAQLPLPRCGSFFPARSQRRSPALTGSKTDFTGLSISSECHTRMHVPELQHRPMHPLKLARINRNILTSHKQKLSSLKLDDQDKANPVMVSSSVDSQQYRVLLPQNSPKETSETGNEHPAHKMLEERMRMLDQESKNPSRDSAMTHGHSQPLGSHLFSPKII